MSRSPGLAGPAASSTPSDPSRVARLAVFIAHLGKQRLALWLTAASVLFSVGCGLVTLLAWNGTQEEWRILLGMCIAVPALIVPPIGWTIATVAIQAEEAQHLAERLAMTDPLTGLYNRRHFLEVAERELQRALRAQRPLSVLLLDIDHFKSINDTHGHGAGDEVLAGVARAALGCLREFDTMARLGGEEFAVLLPDTAVPQAMQQAELVRAGDAALDVTVSGGTVLRVTLSIGVADSIASDASIEQALDRADHAMYSAKQGGRNRVAASAPHALAARVI